MRLSFQPHPLEGGGHVTTVHTSPVPVPILGVGIGQFVIKL